MSTHRAQPVALTIAGSDSGGGAGVQADLKTFASLAVHGATAVTCITAQSPNSISAIRPLPASLVRAQIEEVVEAFSPAACKTGMLLSSEIIRMVHQFIRERPLPLVVDPVMIATSGARLLRPSALRALKELCSAAILVTPNLAEAKVFSGRKVDSPEEMRAAARILHSQLGCAVLVKGGHLKDSLSAIDIFFDGEEEVPLVAPFISQVNTHGTGCTYSAAITALLARGAGLREAVEEAKGYITQAIAQSVRVGEFDVLNSFWGGRI